MTVYYIVILVIILCIVVLWVILSVTKNKDQGWSEHLDSDGNHTYYDRKIIRLKNDKENIKK